MRTLLLAIGTTALLGTAALIAKPTPAEARDYPFCINGEQYATRDCSFTSYDQCLASASGRLAFCEENPFYVAPDRGSRRSNRQPPPSTTPFWRTY